MKQWFLLALIGVIPLAIVAGLTYSFFKWVIQVIQEWRLGYELDQIRAYAEASRGRRSETQAARLDNGCDHAFDTGVGFPPGACPKCGLERARPMGFCDHVWRRAEGNSPGSVCAKCGKVYRVDG
jgi:hypothetical protein